MMKEHVVGVRLLDFIAAAVAGKSSEGEASMFQALFMYTIVVLAVAAGISMVIYLIARVKAWRRSKIGD